MFHDNESSEISSLSKTKCIYYLSYGVAPNVRGISKGCDNLSILGSFEDKIMESVCASGSHFLFSDLFCCYYFILFMIAILATMVIFGQHKFIQVW